MDEPIRVFIIDDHDSVRESYKRWLEVEGFNVVGEAKTFSSCVQSIKKSKPDVVLMDIDFQDDEKGGIKGAKIILKEVGNVKIVFVTHYTEPEIIVEAFTAGCIGYFTKADELKSLKEIIEKAYQGHYSISPTALKNLIEAVRKSPTTIPSPKRKIYQLTEQELKVLNFIAQGLSNKEIAQRLYTNEKRIKNITANILLKLEAKNRAHAVAKGISQGLIIGLPDE